MLQGIDRLLNLSTDQVLSVYSGKDGKCCCGCAGKHSYNPKYQEAGSKHRGYKVTDDECNLAQVTRVLNILKANAADAEISDDYMSVVIGKRLYILYLIQ